MIALVVCILLFCSTAFAQVPTSLLVSLTSQQVNRQHILLQGILDWWRNVPPLSGSQTVYNLIRPYPLSMGGMTSTGTGWVPSACPGHQGAFKFDGSTSYLTPVSTISATQYDFSNTTFYLSVWVSTTGASTQYVFSKRDNVGINVGGWFLRITSTGTVGLRINGSTAPTIDIASTGTVNDGLCHHIVGVYTTDTSTAANNLGWVYIDGKLDVASGSGSQTYLTYPNQMTIGAISDLAAGSFFSGTMDDIRVGLWNPSAAFVRQIYDSGRSGDVDLKRRNIVIADITAAATLKRIRSKMQ